MVGTKLTDPSKWTQPRPEFRFFTICRRSDIDAADGEVTLHKVVDNVREWRDTPTRFCAALGLVMMPVLAGSRLPLMLARVEKSGELSPLPQWRGLPLILPPFAGAATYAFPFEVRFEQPGIYRFLLFDESGAFSTSGQLLATHSFAVLP